MKKKIFGLMLFLIGIFMSTAVSATTDVLPISIDKVKVGDTEVVQGDINRLDIERGQKIDVSVALTAEEDVNDVQVEAFITGYEHGAITDSVFFDATANTTYVKKFKLELPTRVEKDDYVLRVLITSRGAADEILEDYKLKISSQRHSVVIKDVILRPESSIEAGKAVIAVVRVENQGEKDEDGLKITAAIPELKVSDSVFIDELQEGESASSEELWLKIADQCVKTGMYDIKVTVSYLDGDKEVSETSKIEVVQSEACQDGGQQVTDQLIIVGITESQDLKQGGSSVVYPLTITNTGKTSKVLTIEVKDSDWANITVSPSQVVAVNAGETKSVSLFVSAKESAKEGDKILTVNVKDSEGRVIKSLPAKANVVKAEDANGVNLGGLRRGLEIALIVLIVILVIVGLVVAFTRLRGGPEEESGQTYY